MLQWTLLCSNTLAHGRVGPNPASNFKAGPLPPTCTSAPTGARCIDAGVYYLDQARARLHQPPYRLPADFARLKPGPQILILSNLDRIGYHLAPITGLTPALDRVALGGQPGDPGVLGAGDPLLGAPGVQNTSNWAGGFPNIVLAYEAWMYDDGPGSDNRDCKAANQRGCWGHRRDILTRFVAAGPSAMGVASGRDSKGDPSYAMIIAKGSGPYTSGYSYRWSQAVAAGAGRHNYVVRRPDTRTIRFAGVAIFGTTLVVHIAAPRGVSLKCSLSRRQGRGWSSARFRPCKTSARFSGVRRGRYRLRVRSSLGAISTILSVT